MTKYNSFYCPFCQRQISPEVDDDDDGEAIRTEEGGFIYVHDDVRHDESFTFGELQ